ncbi:hypothetical protein Ciccas_010638 [Cichlidogyrus casuarinus]|uniref:Uncharacterized protein n=1 Tax=Cichlidogyrus casuarinus TaxID=1844966 RepID=A0ABD2PV86_9PLAT
MRAKENLQSKYVSPTTRMETETAQRIKKIKDQEEWNRCSANKEVARMVKMKNSSETAKLQMVQNNLDKELTTTLKLLDQEKAAIKSSLTKNKASASLRPRSEHKVEELHLKPPQIQRPATTCEEKSSRTPLADPRTGEVSLYNGKVKCKGLSQEMRETPEIIISTE